MFLNFNKFILVRKLYSLTAVMLTCGGSMVHPTSVKVFLGSIEVSN